MSPEGTQEGKKEHLPRLRLQPLQRVSPKETQELAAKMTGLRYAPAEVKAFLATQPVSTYFRGATPDDLAALLFKPSSE